MLDAFIIEELRRREEIERSEQQRPRMELPLEDARERPQRAPEDDTSGQVPERGVIVIDF